MNGAHDMGGVMGFGPVVPEANEPVFHGDWEARVQGINFVLGRVGGWNIDQGRFARENIHPLDYLKSSYYEIWFGGLLKLLGERGMLSADELAAGHAAGAARPMGATVKPDEVMPLLAAGKPSHRPEQLPARFREGDRVRALNINPIGHTRLPRYVRGHVGTIVLLHGAHVFPDTNSTGAGEHAGWLYTVRFSGRELWGEAADPTVTVSVDAWETYLEPAT